jgi:hypothetical protein
VRTKTAKNLSIPEATLLSEEKKGDDKITTKKPPPRPIRDSKACSTALVRNQKRKATPIAMMIRIKEPP